MTSHHAFAAGKTNNPYARLHDALPKSTIRIVVSEPQVEEETAAEKRQPSFTPRWSFFDKQFSVQPLELGETTAYELEAPPSRGFSINATAPLCPPPPPLPPLNRTDWREILFIFAICLAQLFSLAGLAQSFSALPIIFQTFGITDPGQGSWYTAAYSLTLGTFILPAGRLGDMYGHKRLFLLGWIWFAFSSLLCGLSFLGGSAMFSAMRGLQGIGPALLVPNGIALLGRRFPVGMKRALAIAVFGGSGPMGVTLGCVFSAMIAQLLWWPWMFWAMALACGLACLLAFFAIPPDAIRVDSEVGRFDYLGAISGVLGLLLINLALNEAPVDGWNHLYIPILLLLGLLLMFIFIFIELRIATHPILPIKGLSRDAICTLACIGLGWSSHGIWSYYLYLFVEIVQKHSPLVAAAETCPVAIIGFCAAVAVPYILRRVRVPYLLSVAMLCFALCILFLVTAPVGQMYWTNAFLSVLVAPFAMNWSFPSATILMSNAVAKEHQGIAASLIATMVNYSIATGLGIGGTIARYAAPEKGLLVAYRDVWWLGVAFASAGFLMSLYFIWRTRISKTKSTR